MDHVWVGFLRQEDNLGTYSHLTNSESGFNSIENWEANIKQNQIWLK